MSQEDKSCNPHPDAPHGFDRNASHNAGRYVCECEGWQPVAVQEPVAKVKAHLTGGNVGVSLEAVPVNDYDTLPILRDGTLLYAAPQPPAIDRDAVIALLSDDALATSFQTLGQYRAHLIGVLKSKE